MTRAGDWILPRHFRTVAFMGHAEIDLTCARIGPGTSHIEAVAIMGNVTILVPPELRVECDGDPMLGSFDVHRDVPSATSPNAPLIWISGSAMVGSVEVKVVDPSAPGWIDKLRAKLSKKA